MKRFRTVYDVMPPGVSAAVIFTRGHRLVFDKDGKGYTGNWKMNPHRDFDKLLLYLRRERQPFNPSPRRLPRGSLSLAQEAVRKIVAVVPDPAPAPRQ